MRNCLCNDDCALVLDCKLTHTLTQTERRDRDTVSIVSMFALTLPQSVMNMKSHIAEDS